MSSGETRAREPDVSDLVADLESAANAYERARERVADRGESELQTLGDHYGELQDLFDRYEEEATGDGNFQTFIEFQEAMAKFVERLPEDLPYRDRFEDVDDLMQQRRLTAGDFAEARETLSPVAEDVGLLDERSATQSRYEDLRTRARRRLRELGEREQDLESLLQLGDADLDAPVERLREPIDAYNDAATAAFADFKRDASARAVLGFVEETAAFPLVPYRQPPRKLVSYVDGHEPGTEPIATLLEYADYSDSKLDHYVEDPTALKRAVNTNQTYLRRLDGSPLTVDWPPPAADTLRFRLRELVQVLGRFAPEAVVARARELRSLADRADYERLRRSAQAREQLTETQRERLASGAVADELEATRAARDRLETTLAELPDA